MYEDEEQLTYVILIASFFQTMSLLEYPGSGNKTPLTL